MEATEKCKQFIGIKNNLHINLSVYHDILFKVMANKMGHVMVNSED